MIVISPFLQFLMTLFGSHISALWWLSSRLGGDNSGRQTPMTKGRV